MDLLPFACGLGFPGKNAQIFSFFLVYAFAGGEE